MRFDEARYVQDFIKKLRGARTLPDDLLVRYAITLPATDAEIAAQVSAVRAYWNKAAAGNAFTAQAAKMCRAEDERLRAKHGRSMDKSAWWEAQQAQRRSAAQAAISSLAAELKQRYGQLGVVTGRHPGRLRRETQPDPGRHCPGGQASRPDPGRRREPARISAHSRDSRRSSRTCPNARRVPCRNSSTPAPGHSA